MRTKMNRSASLLCVILLLAAFGSAQTEMPPGFDQKDFAEKAQTAEWLVRYDLVAWKTTDVLMTYDEKETQRLGLEWFCFQDDSKMWNAVYGKLADGKYDAVFHFTYAADGTIERTDKKLDQAFLASHAAALVTARAKLRETVAATAPRFNQYIKQNADGTFTVWLLPAFQSNGLAVYGGEAIYTIDATGKRIIKDDSYFQENFRGFKTSPPREIWLNYRELTKPTLGSIFFALYYSGYFTAIYIDNKSVVSTPKTIDGSYIWVNVLKEKEEENGKTEKKDEN